MVRMYLGDGITSRRWLLAEYREADYNAREPEGWHVRYADSRYFNRLCSYGDDPKAVLLSSIPDPVQPFISWSED